MHKIHNIKNHNLFCISLAEFSQACAFLWQRSILALILAAWCMLGSVQAQTPYYYLNRSFSAVQFNLQGVPTEYQLSEETDKLTDIVQGAIQLNSNETYAIEKQMAIPICYGSAMSAWNAAANYSGTPSNYYGKIFDNVGWVRGTKNTGNDWGAYLWVLQNRIVFKSSATNMWVSSNGIPVAITNVMVGSLGDYGPSSNVVDIGPRIPTNFPGDNKSYSGTYQVDITNVFYELSIPDIWITPRDAAVAMGSSNVQYTVYGTNIPKGVAWTIYQTNFTGHAILQTNVNWHYASVTPGSVATNYTVRATSVDNTNFYDQVELTVRKVDIVETNIYIAVSNTTTLHLTADSSANTQWEIIPMLQNGVSIEGSSVGTSVVINAGSIPTNYTVKAYAEDLTNCYDTCTVTVLNVELITTHEHGLWWFNGENPDNYDGIGTLVVQNVIEGTFQWDVIAGTNKVELYKYGEYTNSITITDDNTVTIKSIGASEIDDDVTVKFTYNSAEICQYNLSVRTPNEEVETNLIHVALSYMGYTNGYDSKHEFVIIDQLGEDLPADVYLNEHWTEDPTNDYTPSNNWGEIEAEKWQYPGTNTDHLWSCRYGTSIPNTQNPQTPLGNTNVLHFNGEHYIGSDTEGRGVKVLMKKWQYYQDHGRRE